MILCGTGHRPNKLGGYSEETAAKVTSFARQFLVDNLLDVDVVISGMALGWDQALAKAAIDLGIPVKAYIPFIGMETKWPNKSQLEFHAILRNIPEENWVICSDGDYSAWKMQKRNEDMVDASDIVLALWNGTDGGTKNCIMYAERKGKKVMNLWEHYQSEP